MNAAITILRRGQVEAKTGLSCSTIYEFVKREIFPKPVSLGGRQVGWVESEVDAWLSEKIAARDSSVAGLQS